MKQRLLVLFTLLISALFLLPSLSYSIQPVKKTTEQQGVEVQAAEVDDGDVANAENQPQQAQASVLSGWLHMLDKEENDEIENSSVMAFGPQVPGDLARILKPAGGVRGGAGLLAVIAWSILSICIGFLIVFGVKRIARNRVAQIGELTPPGNDSFSCLWATILRNVPSLVGLFVLAISTTAVFLILGAKITIEGRMVFQFIFGTVLLILLCSIIGRMIFSPDDARIRALKLDDTQVKPLYRAFVTSVATLFSGKLFIHLIRELGALDQTISWVVIVLGSVVMAVFAFLVMYLKKPVAGYLQSGIEVDSSSWFKEQLAVYWHIPALLYLFLVWFIWIGREMSGTLLRDGSFIVSLLIVPIYFILSYAGLAIIRSVIDSLGLGAQTENEEAATLEEAADEPVAADTHMEIESKSYLVFRIILVAVLTAWVLSLWGYDVPFAANAVGAILKALVIIALALISWRFAASFIERKIEEATPEVTEKEEDVDDEFGGAAPMGRSHTLLPMLRKVIGSTLVVMVILIVLSSLGVNISPLLAGAGVLGLAIGFGAQKLVSDVLSGFFFLLDDAFRIGEYIQAGSIRGSVEAITLRNVMLRHHLGMLQIVPHSDLGAVTNYMRGGIVIKFPLEFPYDTDIDKVRKIIKKVGQAMLTDEEIGDDFILPVKSQGVNEITNSVMVIRVKFTAKPGKQFVIKREAFRRITEALNAKGIFYAHRKVIVDFPADDRKALLDDETRKKVLEAGAAAVTAVEADKQNQIEKETKEL